MLLALQNNILLIDLLEPSISKNHFDDFVFDVSNLSIRWDRRSFDSWVFML